MKFSVLAKNGLGVVAINTKHSVRNHFIVEKSFATKTNIDWWKVCVKKIASQPGENNWLLVAEGGSGEKDKV